MVSTALLDLPFSGLTWHADVFFYPSVDGVVFLLALAGLYWEWRERRWVVVWIATGLLFLLLWPTKWPQYTLILTPALCLAAASTVTRAYRWFREQELYWAWFEQMVPGRRSLSGSCWVRFS